MIQVSFQEGSQMNQLITMRLPIVVAVVLEKLTGLVHRLRL